MSGSGTVRAVSTGEGAPFSCAVLISLPGEGAPASDSGLFRTTCRGCGTVWSCLEDDGPGQARRLLWYCPLCGALLPVNVVVWVGGTLWVEDDVSSYSDDEFIFYVSEHAGHWHLRDRGTTWHLRTDVDRVPGSEPPSSALTCCRFPPRPSEQEGP